ncbi:hypothetical protein ROHU_000420 [Labeo rohita]|uniref:Uncharacterized protein n=1 Tax=Labeo rohita TaxID=84645 RepID=A0A498P6M9_LABRO|nr:hypothetical protein ROHU_000420 [Labeo rohita]
MILRKRRAGEDQLSEEEDYAEVPETPLDDNKDEEGELMMRRTPQVKRKRPLTRLTGMQTFATGPEKEQWKVWL